MAKRFFVQLLCMLLAALFILSASAEDTMCLRVGQIEHYASEIQTDIDLVIAGYAQAGNPLSIDDRHELVKQVMDLYEYRAIIEMRLTELGLAEPDENTVYELRQQAQQLYDADWQSLRNSSASLSLTDEQLTAYMAEQGLTLASYYQELLVNYRSEMLLSAYQATPTVTDDDVWQYYEETLVAPCREMYENNIPLFEQEVLYGDGSSAWVPDGYLMLDQIVIPVPDEQQRQLDDVYAQAQQLEAEAQNIYGQIAAAAIAGDDVTALRDAYQATVDAYDQLTTTYSQLWRDVLLTTEPLTDELYARLQSGETFDQLATVFGGKQRLIYHPESEMWPDTMRDAAALLKEPGDVSAPALCADGIHILYYVKPMTTGIMQPPDEDMDLLHQLTVQKKKGELLDAIVELLRPIYDITRDMSALHY